MLREALVAMFEHDRSAARGEMAMRKAIAFKHANALGNAPAHALFERVRVGRNIDGEFRTIDRRLDNQPPARQFSEYIVEIDRDELPNGVEIVEWL
jgi:CRISPR-associated protein Csd2